MWLSSGFFSVQSLAPLCPFSSTLTAESDEATILQGSGARSGQVSHRRALSSLWAETTRRKR